MPINEELRRQLEQAQREKLEERQRIQNEELTRLNEERKQDRERIEKSQEGGPINERPTSDDDD